MTAIVFGFVTYELREISCSITEKTLLVFPLIGFMLLTVMSMSIGAMVVNGSNFPIVVLLEVTGNCLFNIMYVFPIMIAKEHWNNIAK